MNTFFKIIIPNYNNSEWLEKCFDSIFSQTFQDFYVVVIDDVSTDNSVEILKKYKEKYPNQFDYKVLTEKRWNGGSRNVGLTSFAQTHSQYTLFLDSDDTYVDNNCLETIHQLIINNNYPDCIRLSYNYCSGDEITLNILTEISPAAMVSNCNVACWTKCLKSNLIPLFPENTLMEDVVQHIAACDIISTIVPCSTPIINWNRNNSNSCSSHIDLQNRKWEDSLPRFINDLTNLKCTHDYCEQERLVRLKRAKNNLAQGLIIQ